MNALSEAPRDTPRLSRAVSVVFAGFAVVWFVELFFMAVPALSRIHSALWLVPIPANPQLAIVLQITWALSAPAKGALLVMAIAGLRSKSPSARAVLFAAMALVPPLNMAFPFRQQGFLLKPMAIATTLTIITWGTFFLAREYKRATKRAESRSPLSRWEIAQYVWLGVQSAVLTVIALLFLFETRIALNQVLPSLTGLFNTHEGMLTSPIHSTMAAGTHYLAVSVASWLATIRFRTDLPLRRAMTLANTVFAGLFIAVPIVQIAMAFGAGSIPVLLVGVFASLFVGGCLFLRTESKSS